MVKAQLSQEHSQGRSWVWNWVAPLGLMVVLAGTVAALQVPRLQARTTEQPLDAAVEATREAMISAQLRLRAQVPTLGFDNLLAGWTFLEFVQYFGDSEARSLTGYDILPDFFEVIVRRDPYFTFSYLFLSSSITLYAGKPEDTVRLLDQGIARLSPTFPPNSFQVVRLKAIDELLFLGRPADARISFLKTAEWAEQSPLPDADRSANSARQTAEFLAANRDPRPAQVNAWLLVLTTAINEDVQALALNRIEALGYGVTFDGMQVQVTPPEDLISE